MPEPLIKTSSWFTKLPDDHLRVGISRGVPRTQPAGYRIYRGLAPGSWFNSVSVAEYDRLYRKILSKLDPRVVVLNLLDLAPGRIPVLYCFEQPDSGEWCHRSLCARWLTRAGYPAVHEFGFEDASEHPLLPPELRRPLAAE